MHNEYHMKSISNFIGRDKFVNGVWLEILTTSFIADKLNTTMMTDGWVLLLHKYYVAMINLKS